MCKGYCKVSNVENVQNKLLRDVQNAKVYGIAQEIVKFLIGPIINNHAIRRSNK